MELNSWLILGIFSMCFHALLSIPILLWATRNVWRHQNETFFKSRKKLLIKIVLIFSIFMIIILRPIELILGPFRFVILNETQIPDFLITWFIFMTMNTSSFVVIQLYVLRAWIYFFNIQSVLALQDKLWEKTLYSTNYDNWYLKSAATYGNVKFCSGIISIFSIFFIIILCIIRIVDSHSNGYIAVIFGFQSSLMILSIILFIVIANIYSVNDLFALRNELKFDLIILSIVFIILCCITTIFWNDYQIIWFAFLEVTSLLQLMQSIMPCFWYYRVQRKYTKKQLNKKRNQWSTETSSISKRTSNVVTSVSPGSSPMNAAMNDSNKLKIWWLSITNTINKRSTDIPDGDGDIANKSNNNPHNSMELHISNHMQHSDKHIHPKSLKLEDVVCDPQGFREFIKFLSLSFSSENMLFIAEVMRFKNFMFMRGLVTPGNIGYYIDLPSNVIDFMWYIPDEYRNVNHARKVRKKRRSQSQNRNRRSFTLPRLQSTHSQKNDKNSGLLLVQTKSAPVTPEPDETDGKESKHKKRMQWMQQRQRMKEKHVHKGNGHKKKEKKQQLKPDDIDLGAVSDIEDNVEDDFIIVSDDEDDESISLKATPKVTAMIAPNLLEAALSKRCKTDEEDVSRHSSVRFALNDTDIDLNEDTEHTMHDAVKIEDFFEGFEEKEMDELLITPLEDAQRIRDRYIVNGAEFQVNLSGGMQWQTLQQFSNDPPDIDWKSKMLEIKEKSAAKRRIKHAKNDSNNKPLSLVNVPTDTASLAQDRRIKMCTPSNISRPSNSSINIIKENKQDATDDIKEEETKINMDDIISRFDIACDAIIKQLLLHEFDRFRNTDDYMAYFKSYKKSRKRLGSIYKKFQKKTSHILPSHHHQSPQLTSVRQLSMHKQCSLRDSITPLKMIKAKSATVKSDNQCVASKLSKRNSFTSGQRQSSKSRHIAISHISTADLSRNISSTYSGIFTLLNSTLDPATPQSVSTKIKNCTPIGNDMEVVMEDVKYDYTETVTDSKDEVKPMVIHKKNSTMSSNRSSTSNTNKKLSLIRERPLPVHVSIDIERKTLNVITPLDITPIVEGRYGYPMHMEMSDDQGSDELKEEEQQDEEKLQYIDEEQKESHKEEKGNRLTDFNL